MMFANVIIPAASLPYLGLLLPWNIVIVLAVELYVWKRFNRQAPLSGLITMIVLTNLGSTAIGCLGMDLFRLPWGYEEGPNGAALVSDSYLGIVFVAMLIACLMSIAIEGCLVIFFRKWLNLRRCVFCVVVANFCSYIALSAGLAVLFIGSP